MEPTPPSSSAPANPPERDWLIFCGLLLSKYNRAALSGLGFKSYREAYNLFASALGGKPASIKNYRDELDPLFHSQRKGWRNRAVRDHCRAVFEKFGDFDLATLLAIAESLISTGGARDTRSWRPESSMTDPSTYAQRLATGMAAERYFQDHAAAVADFHECKITDTRALGCGFDFKLDEPRTGRTFAVEVKGIRAARGEVLLTEKEHDAALQLGDAYFLFVVHNFVATPFHRVWRNPVSDLISWKRQEVIVRRQEWRANL